VNGFWTIVQTPKDIKLIGYKWVFTQNKMRIINC